jgi:hypothetical protein
MNETDKDLATYWFTSPPFRRPRPLGDGICEFLARGRIKEVISDDLSPTQEETRTSLKGTHAM